MKIFFNIMIVLWFILCNMPVSADSVQAKLLEQYVDILNEKIRICQAGSGQAVLLIHGLPGCLEDWEAMLPELSKRFHVIAYDRPGHGLSSANNLKYNLNHNADIALELIHKLDLKNPIIVGHSYGGSIVLAMAVRNTPNIKAFISVSPIISTKRKPDLIFKILKIPLMGPALRIFIELFLRTIVKKGMDIAFHPNQKDMPSHFIEKRCMMISRAGNITTVANEEMSMHPDLLNLAPFYGNIKKPFFIVTGISDKVVCMDDVRLLYENLPGSKLIIFENTGHMVQYAKPSELIKVIEEASE